MTFDELEKWLVLMFARYHRAVHSGIGTTPLTKWREGILGTREKIGRGLPPIRTDAEKVRIDFMPYVDRTIQDYGVAIDGIHYFHDILRPWVNARDTKNSRQTRQFRFRYDPSDMSVLYFFRSRPQTLFPDSLSRHESPSGEYLGDSRGQEDGTRYGHGEVPRA
ncbi:Mu transposase C-terminal domain-containing protein [Ralstonia sp. GP101]|uniref:Mu transposase C-terminal domain-containing protein n=1 Tax=Ralstonia sp. GP101 TaxID=3035146 RepID=UPI0038911FEB